MTQPKTPVSSPTRLAEPTLRFALAVGTILGTLSACGGGSGAGSAGALSISAAAGDDTADRGTMSHADFAKAGDPRSLEERSMESWKLVASISEANASRRSASAPGHNKDSAPAPAPAPGSTLAPAPAPAPTPAPAPAPTPAPQVTTVVAPTAGVTVAVAPSPATAPISTTTTTPTLTPTPTPTTSTTGTPTVAPLAPPPTSVSVAVDSSKMPAAGAGFPDLRLKTTGVRGIEFGIGAFRTVCGFSHMGYDDPIVFPGQPNKAHLHTFFGNTGTNAFTTAESLRTTGGSTCRGGTANRSSYWIPSMIDTASGEPLVPLHGVFYYKQGYKLNPSSSIQAVPAGLRMIVGEASNRAPGASPGGFTCHKGGVPGASAAGQIPVCEAGSDQLLITLAFPQCWDGKNLDSPDHKSHMSNPVQQQSYPYLWHCPTSHPVAIPEIAFNIWYTVGPQGTRSWRLSSDTYDASMPGGASMHGDWFEGWDRDVANTWARDCVQASRDCFAHLIGDGREIY